MTDEREAAFHREMIGIYERAKREVGYTANRFLQMLTMDRGVTVAHRLLRAGQYSDGLGTLIAAGRSDLTVEALVQRAEFRELFTAEEIAEAEARVGRLDSA